MSITFHKIRREGIFCTDFQELSTNNKLEFSELGIIVIYGPNGVGKTSLAKVFDNEANSELVFTLDGEKIENNSDDTYFHNIADQNGRNIIEGNTEDFVLGDNIKREYELKNLIEDEFDEIFNSKLIPTLKKTFGISTKKSKFDSKLTNATLSTYISYLANVQNKGQSIDRNEFLPPVRFHDLRHTHATIMLKEGIHPKIVSERLGHASINITLDTYSHVLPGMQETAALAFEEALQATSRETAPTTI